MRVGKDITPSGGFFLTRFMTRLAPVSEPGVSNFKVQSQTNNLLIGLYTHSQFYPRTSKNLYTPSVMISTDHILGNHKFNTKSSTSHAGRKVPF